MEIQLAVPQYKDLSKAFPLAEGQWTSKQGTTLQQLQKDFFKRIVIPLDPECQNLPCLVKTPLKVPLLGDQDCCLFFLSDMGVFGSYGKVGSKYLFKSKSSNNLPCQIRFDQKQLENQFQLAVFRKVLQHQSKGNCYISCDFDVKGPKSDAFSYGSALLLNFIIGCQKTHQPSLPVSYQKITSYLQEFPVESRKVIKCQFQQLLGGKNFHLSFKSDARRVDVPFEKKYKFITVCCQQSKDQSNQLSGRLSQLQLQLSSSLNICNQKGLASNSLQQCQKLIASIDSIQFSSDKILQDKMRKRLRQYLQQRMAVLLFANEKPSAQVLGAVLNQQEALKQLVQPATGTTKSVLQFLKQRTIGVCRVGFSNYAVAIVHSSKATELLHKTIKQFYGREDLQLGGLVFLSNPSSGASILTDFQTQKVQDDCDW